MCRAAGSQAYASIKRILPNTDEKQCSSSPIKVQATSGVVTKHSVAPHGCGRLTMDGDP